METPQELTESGGSFVRKQFVSTSDKPDLAHDVYEYPSKGRRYFRYVANRGHDIIHSIHIPGGSIQNPQARGRADQVRRWIAAGLKPAEIVKAIGKWR